MHIASFSYTVLCDHKHLYASGVRIIVFQDLVLSCLRHQTYSACGAIHNRVDGGDAESDVVSGVKDSGDSGQTTEI